MRVCINDGEENIGSKPTNGAIARLRYAVLTTSRSFMRTIVFRACLCGACLESAQTRHSWTWSGLSEPCANLAGMSNALAQDENT